MKIRHKLNSLLRIYDKRFLRYGITLCLLSTINTLCALTLPYLIKLTVDEGISKKNFSMFLAFCILAAIIVTIKQLAGIFTTLKEQRITASLNMDLSNKVFTGIHSMPYSWFAANSAGKLLVNLEDDTNTLVMFPAALISLLNEGIKAAVAFVVIFTFNTDIALILILSLPILYLTMRLSVKRLDQICRQELDNEEAITGYLEESFWRAYLIKIFFAINQARRRYMRLMLDHTRLTLKRENDTQIAAAFPAVIPMAITGAIYIWSGYLAIYHNLTIGSIAAIGGYIYQFMGSASDLFHRTRDIYPTTIALERIEPFLANKSIQKTHTSATTNGTIKIDALTFGYKSTIPVIKNLHINIETGKYVIINGPSGCGKSTLLNLLIGVYQPQNGEIIIDNKTILCPQEPMLWNTSVRKNIAYPKNNIDDNLLRSTAELCGAKEFIENLEHDYDTSIGENAACLSHGQKQRLSLMRALIKCPNILLLDEAFSGIPQEEENLIIAAIRRQYPKMTIVSATHRITNLKYYDYIITLEKN